LGCPVPVQVRTNEQTYRETVSVWTNTLIYYILRDHHADDGAHAFGALET